MKHLIIMRHGTAQPHSAGGDFSRALVPEGAKEAQATSRILRKAGIVPGVILSSPLIRARQTAEEAAKAFGLSVDTIATDNELAPGGDKEIVLQSVQRLFEDHATVMLTGHQPYLGEMIALLLFGREIDEMHLSKGGVAVFEISGNAGKTPQELVLLVDPKTAGALLSR
ncbi:MAG TPA: phosphohistidine phosphatase SixA [bacterium]|nr:phosphohistidine phosphatase SixA [bacterium]